MQHTDNHPEREIYELRDEIASFQKEKERVRAIVGSIGGVPTVNTKLFNICFTIFVIACMGISLYIDDRRLQLFMIELAVAAVSFKILFMMHAQARVNHFQLWVMSSLEWRINELIKKIDAIEEQVGTGKDG